MLNINNILGVKITNETDENILEYIFKRLRSEHHKQGKLFIVTPNPEILVYATKHPEYSMKLNHADIALPDGVGLFMASLFMGKAFKERIPGVDFMEKLCEESVEKGLSIGLLGGRGDVAERAAECLQQKYPGIDVVFIGEEWSDAGFISHKVTKSSSHPTSPGLRGTSKVEVLKTSKPTIDILFVAFGFPKQEEWIYENLEKLPVKAAMGVGGAFDYLSGEVMRAPYLFRAMGMEWLFRLIRQPWRIKRQFALIEFVGLVLKEIVQNKRVKSKE